MLSVDTARTPNHTFVIPAQAGISTDSRCKENYRITESHACISNPAEIPACAGMTGVVIRLLCLAGVKSPHNGLVIDG